MKRRIFKRYKTKKKGGQHYKVNYSMGLFYHGTHKGAVPGILKEGLKPSKEIKEEFKKQGIDFDPKMSNLTEEDKVYFFKNPKHAETWAKVVSEHTGFKPEVLEVDIEDDKIERDLEMPFGESYKYKGKIIPEKIKIK